MAPPLQVTTSPVDIVCCARPLLGRPWVARMISRSVAKDVCDAGCCYWAALCLPLNLEGTLSLLAPNLDQRPLSGLLRTGEGLVFRPARPSRPTFTRGCGIRPGASHETLPGDDVHLPAHLIDRHSVFLNGVAEAQALPADRDFSLPSFFRRCSDWAPRRHSVPPGSKRLR